MSTAISQWKIQHAVKILKQGGLIAYPTEAVYGIGCLADKTETIERLLRLKQRPIEKGLILLAADLTQLDTYIKPLDSGLQSKLMASWPGPTTWIVPARTHTSRLIRGQFDSIAIRISDHPIVQAICQQCSQPLISTSANITGKAMSYTPLEVRLHFSDQLDYILNGPLGDNLTPTTIKDALTDQVLRS